VCAVSYQGVEDLLLFLILPVVESRVDVVLDALLARIRRLDQADDPEVMADQLKACFLGGSRDRQIGLLRSGVADLDEIDAGRGERLDGLYAFDCASGADPPVDRSPASAAGRRTGRATRCSPAFCPAS
jgi:hypothetical protein